MTYNSSQLSESAQLVQNFLVEKGFTFSVLELPDSTRSAAEAASTIGCEIAQIIKSLVFCIEETQQPILILASGANRVNEKIIETTIGNKIIKAEANFIRQITGFAIGGIPPIGHKQAIDTYIDEDLLNHNELWAAAGTPHAVFKLPPSDLINLTKGTTLSIK